MATSRRSTQVSKMAAHRTATKSLFRARYCKELRSQGGGEMEIPGEELLVLDNFIYRLYLL